MEQNSQSHKADRWSVVDASDQQIVLFATCVCGGEDCGFSTVVYLKGSNPAHVDHLT